MKEKLDILCSKFNLSASALAKTLGVEASAISHIRSGRNKPSYDFVVKILRAFPNINPDWLLLDGEDMLRSGASSAPLSSKTSDTFEGSLFSEEQNITISAGSENVKNEISDIFQQPKYGAKRAKRVILIYSDGSFDSYEAATDK